MAPDLFDMDDDVRGRVLEPEVPEHLQEQARRAVRECPERAVRITE